MKPILLIYRTKTGFTKKYAEWISKEVTCKTIPLEKIKDEDINSYNIIIYGAGMHAGRIQGLNKFKKNVLNLADKKIIVFATGGTPCIEKVVTKIKKDNFTDEELENINKFYYFQSGVNYERMGMVDKAIMKTYSKILDLKNNKSKIEEGTRNAISKSYDNSSREYIKPMVDYINQLI
ncbi:flavodoxin domain-containing protein [Herbivorax sp. ANBcel31]|uniref:flavodoxin domain-containing protein n=1 Tax=Herbivorax sp. ANBcel31 TaxID=3069754 RepID=UPI0027B4A8D2|nr:flavodoxin domain-containing protein [Herbivorax sp. ANBcel31]MDQ2087897.1 flavodoxin domain-containing protein [Herbivorax sp. ANBcel31]